MYHSNFHTKMMIANIFNQLKTHPIESLGHTVGTPLYAYAITQNG